MVYSNDPQHTSTKISVSCVVKPHVIIEPSSRINLVGFEGEKINKEVTIASVEGQSLKITDITCDIEDKIKYKLKTVKKDKEYTLKVKNRSTKKEAFRGKIVLKTTHPKKPEITFSVYVQLKGEVIVSPQTLSFGTIDTTQEGFNMKKLVKKIKFKGLREEGLTIKRIKTSSDWILVKTYAQKGGKQYSIIVTLDKDRLPRGLFEEKIDIRTNYKRESLVVSVKGKVI